MRLLNLDKSPCISHPDYFWLECPHHKKDKNEEPCSNCNLPSRYDDRTSYGIRKWHSPRTEKKGIIKKSKAKENILKIAIDNGYIDSLEMIMDYRRKGYSVEKISKILGTSTMPVRRILNKSNDTMESKRL